MRPKTSLHRTNIEYNGAHAHTHTQKTTPRQQPQVNRVTLFYNPFLHVVSHGLFGKKKTTKKHDLQFHATPIKGTQCRVTSTSASNPESISPKLHSPPVATISSRGCTRLVVIPPIACALIMSFLIFPSISGYSPP